MNECLLVCLCYHFILFADIIWEASMRQGFGKSMIAFVLTLLGVNTFIILKISFKTISMFIRKKCHQRRVKKQMELKKEVDT